MFTGLTEEINRLNSNVNDVANSQKAKELRNKLLRIGIPLTVIGALGVFICFVSFAVAGMKLDGFGPGIIIPFVLFIPFGAVFSIGLYITRLGLSIVITGYTSKLIDETVGNRCPKCNDIIEKSEIFCSNCGTKLRKKCEKCGSINDSKNNYCEKCGEKLEA